MDRLGAMNVLLHIVDKGSLTAAAEALDLSLPTVVRTLAALERRIGTRLINRTTRRMHLTDEGREFVERCRTVVAAFEEAESSVSARRSAPQGRLAITAPVLFGRRFVAPAVRDFLRAHPKVSVDLLLLDRLVGLVEEGIDVGVRIGALSDSSLVALPVGHVRRVACASPNYLQRNGVPRHPRELQTHRCVSFGAITPGAEWPFHEGRKRIAVRVERLFTCNQVDAAIEACEEGLGPGMFLSYQVAHLRAAKSLRYILEEFEPEPLPVSLVYPHAKLASATVRAFVEACRSRLQEAAFA